MTKLIDRTVRRGILIAGLTASLVLAACASEAPDDAEPDATEDVAAQDDELDEADEGGQEEPEEGGEEEPETGSSVHHLPEPTEVMLGTASGIQTFVIDVMQEQGIDEEHNLVFDRADVLSPPALHTAIAEGAVEIGFGGILQMTVARAQGRGTVVTNVIASPSNLIVSKPDSGIESIGDLQDATLGIFSGCQGQFYQMTQALAEAQYGFDLGSETDCLEAPNPALVALLDDGELDAALLGGVDSIRVVLEDDYTIVSDLSEAWIDEYGFLPGHVTVAAREEFIDENEEVVVAFNSAIKQTLEYIDENPDVWDEFAEMLEIDSPEAAEVLQDRQATRLISVWDETQLEAEVELLELLIELAPPDTFVEEVPDGLFRLDLQPERWEG